MVLARIGRSLAVMRSMISAPRFLYLPSRFRSSIMVSSYAVLLFIGWKREFMHAWMNGWMNECFDHVGWDDIGAHGIARSISCVSVLGL